MRGIGDRESDGSRGVSVVGVRTGKHGQAIAVVRNPLLVPLAFIEILVAGGLLALNYCLRFDPVIRDDCDMVNFTSVILDCKDNSYLYRPYYAYQEDHETHDLTKTSGATFHLPEWAFFTSLFVTPILMVILVEGVRYFFPARKVKDVATWKYVLAPAYRRIPRFIYGYILGLGIVGVVVSCLKLLIPMARPHFLSLCGMTLPSCVAGGIWYPSATCSTGSTGDFSLSDQREGLRSFPSYHATLASYGGVWLCAYITKAARVPGVYGGPQVLNSGILIMAIVGGSHRLVTGYSHPSDIIIGAIIGALAALIVVFRILNGFKEHKWKLHKSRNDNGLLPIQPLDQPNKEQGKALPAKTLPSAPWDTPDTHNNPVGELSVSDIGSSSSDSELEDEVDYNALTMQSESFPIIPRAKRSTVVNPYKEASEAVNSNFGPSNAPPAPPLPPPSYRRQEPQAWTTQASQDSRYNVPRQRYSAPAFPQSLAAPAYTPPGTNYSTARSLRFTSASSPQSPYGREDGGVLNLAYDSETLPRSRTETSSYF
ncbi:unnamed protein product [Meganyctiphanes norvegica]|uniref:Phosphatidic acid phosphatase type 2/haloperoxidase domain-containing protein n=1 Tax=Meganyctiphanes norvegica TaxID=48144 RepID=A0AAV2RVN0_MEGNR